MRIPVFVLLLTIGVVASVTAQTIVQAGDVAGTWPLANSPYHIMGDITIPDDSTLSIAPGVRVEFHGHYALYIRGSLLAIGTESDSITFTVNDTTGFADPDTTQGGWYGLRMFEPDSSNDSTVIAYCKFSYGKAIGPNWPFNHGGAVSIVGFDKVRISNCLFVNNLAGGPEYPTGGALGFSQADLLIVGNTFAHNRAGFGGGANGQSTNARVIKNRFVNNTASSGGGLALAWSGAEILQNSFTGNQASYGGAMATSLSNPALRGNLFTKNSGTDAGGLAFAQGSNATLTGDTVSGNTASNLAGGINVFESSATLNDVVISRNTAGTGGGVYANRADLVLKGCVLEANATTAGNGGALGFGCDTALPGRRYRLELAASRFVDNRASAIGGAMWVNQGTSDTSLVRLTIDQCTFTRNTARSLGAFQIGGRIEDFVLSNSTISLNTVSTYGGGAAFSGGGTGTISNCLFARNESGTGTTGGALGVTTGTKVDILNCTIAHNTAQAGSALRIARGGAATLTNSILWGNSGRHTVLLDVDSLGGMLIVNSCDIQYAMDSIDVDTLSTLTWGDGNMDDNPLFEDSGSMDYHLFSGSPCIGAGMDSLQVGARRLFAPQWDADGNPRPMPAGTPPDMGAYEEQASTPTAVPKDAELQRAFLLEQNYPNPFNPTTAIRFRLPTTTRVCVALYDLLGRKVAVLTNGWMEPGSHEISFDAEGLTSGVYFYRLTAGELVQTKKMILVK